MLNQTDIVINKVENALLATFQATLSETSLAQFQTSLLNRISDPSVQYVLCDLSGVDILDIDEYLSITKTFNMASLMGVNTIMVGLNPGVAATLVDYDIDISQFQYALNIDDALLLTRNQ